MRWNSCENYIEKRLREVSWKNLEKSIKEPYISGKVYRAIRKRSILNDVEHFKYDLKSIILDILHKQKCEKEKRRFRFYRNIYLSFFLFFLVMFLWNLTR